MSLRSGLLGAFVTSWTLLEVSAHRVWAGDDPLNDRCAAAIALELPDSVLGDQSAATRPGPDEKDDTPNSGCGATLTDPALWYTFIGSGDPVVVSTCSEDTDYDTKLSVYCGPCENLLCLAGIDDSEECGIDRFHSTVVVPTEPGERYTVYVHAFFRRTGRFRLTLTPLETPRPPGDSCELATPIAVGESIDSTTSDKLPEASLSPCAEHIKSKTQWFRVLGTGEMLTASLCGSPPGFDSRPLVFRGGCAALECVDVERKTCGRHSELAWQSTLGEEYLVQVRGLGFFDGGDFRLSLREDLSTGPDTCAEALPISLPGGVFATTAGATPDTVPKECSPNLEDGPGVWYSFVGNGADVVVSTCDSDIDTRLSILTDACRETPVCVASDDDSQLPGCETQSELRFPTLSDTTYHVLLRGSDGTAGAFSLQLSTPPATNDDCDGARPIEWIEDEPEPGVTRLSGMASVDTRFATGDQTFAGDPCQRDAGPGVWFAIDGTGADLALSTCDQPGDLDATLTVYEGSCEELHCLATSGAEGPGPCRRGARRLFPSVEGTTYYVLVSSRDPQGVGQTELLVESTISETGGLQMPGDINQDTLLDLTDGVILFRFLFQGQPATLACGPDGVTSPGNLLLGDWNGDGELDLTDGIALLDWIFVGAPGHVLGGSCQALAGCPSACEI